MMINKNDTYEKYKNWFENTRNGNSFSRLGKTFLTERNFYFLDTGTGKVFQVNKHVYSILKTLFETDNFDAIFNLDIPLQEIYVALDEIQTTVLTDSILLAPPVTEEIMLGPQTHSLEHEVMHKLRQTTLELTQRCNLRCDYCIYQENQKFFRNFGNQDMTIDIAKKAIDDLAARSSESETVYLGFYGGEPLLCYPLIVECIEYAKQKINNKKLCFSMTSNLTLLTKEMANYFANLENEFVILASLDGPQGIHDKYRKYPDGSGSFNDTLRGLKYAIDSFGEKINNIMLSVVICGPDYYEDLDSIYNFIHTTSWIPDDIGVTISHKGVYVPPTEYTQLTSLEELQYYEDEDIHKDPILNWNYNLEKEKNDLFTSGYADKILYRIHDRPIYNFPIKYYPLNGCCIPFARRTYITTRGDILLCEKVGDMPSVGNVTCGINIDLIKKIYVDDYIKEATKYCGDCWAINICASCYINCYDEAGINFKLRHASCRYTRFSIYQDLITYHKILETTPEKLQYLNELTFN